MPLPILRVEDQPSNDVLVRLFHRTESVWAAQLSEAVHLDFGTAYANPEIPHVWEANAIHDARVPAGMRVDEILKSADDHFARLGSQCRLWILNPSAPVEERQPLIQHFESASYRKLVSNILHLKGKIVSPPEPRTDLTIIPARASFRHMEILANESAKKWNQPQVAQAEMMHLDDPHWDCLLALKSGEAVATIGVLSVGDIGRIENVFVTESARHQGIGKTMMTRAMEICARSIFKHVFVAVVPDNVNAIRLYERFGFEKVGEFTSYVRPS